jgi:hypothetical protein
MFCVVLPQEPGFFEEGGTNMNWLQQPLSKRSGGELGCKPNLEQLETRNLLSRATLAVASGIVNQ